MSAAHTPGPWEARDHYVHSKGVRFIAVAGTRTPSCPNEDEAIANAHLIAAAPDLLKACKGIIQLLELVNAPGTNDPIEARVYQARAAIAKAEGRTDYGRTTLAPDDMPAKLEPR